MKKLLSVLLVLAMVVSCIAVMQMTTFAASEETLIDVNFDDSKAAGYNHDQIMNNSTEVTVTHEKVDGNNVLKFVTKKAWEVPMWHLGSKIKAFAQTNPGKNICIIVSADAKGDSVANTARLIFRNKSGGGTTIVNQKGIENKWVTFAGFSLINEADALAADAQDYRLTFDNVGNGGDITTARTVLLDNLKVTLKAMDKIVGFEYEVTETNKEQMGPVIYNSAWNSDLSFLKSEAKDGKVTLNYTFYNMSDVDLKLQPSLQVYWAFATLDGKQATPAAIVKAKTSQTIALTFDLDAALAMKHNDGTDNLVKATLRFDFFDAEGNAGVPVGTKFAIIPENEKLVDPMSKCSGVAVAAAPIGEAPVLPTPGEDETPTPGEDATPTPTPQVATGFTAELVNDVTEAAQGQWFKTKEGVFSAADVSNNKLTVKFPVKNTGNQDIKVRLELQTVHKKANGDPVWAGPVAGTYVDIPVGETVDVEYTVDVKNGKISVTSNDNTAEYDISAFFARIDIKNAEGGDLFDKGMAFTAFTGKKLADAFVEMKDENKKASSIKLNLPMQTPLTAATCFPLRSLLLQLLQPLRSLL